MKRIILYTGKGGTGKSVISCVTGLKLAELGYKTLVMSVDPAHTLADAFGKRIRDEAEEVINNLFAVQVDPVAEIKKNFYIVQDYLASVFEAKGIDETLAYEIASLPSTTQFFALLKLDDYLQKDIFDVIILDTVPSGETLRYLYFPRLIGNVSRKLIKLFSPIAEIGKILEPIFHIPAPSKEVINTKVTLFEKIERLANVLTNQDICSVRLIANPDSFSIETMKRTLVVSNLYGVNVDLVIVNKVIPDEVQDPYFLKWKDAQKQYIEIAKTSFYPVPLKILRLFNSELKGIDKLRKCSDELFDDDPSKVYFKGSPFELTKLSNGILARFRVPFTGKEDFEIERIGEELLVKVKLDVGEIVNVLPLPAIANIMSLRSAKLRDGVLEVKFVREGKAS
jgi:arsenite-transporting ATPase